LLYPIELSGHPLYKCAANINIITIKKGFPKEIEKSFIVIGPAGVIRCAVIGLRRHLRFARHSMNDNE
jgi:hypothetical protein